MTHDDRGRAASAASGGQRDDEPVDLADARAVLLAERDESQQRVTALSREIDSVVEAATGVATDDEHDPEGATIAFERARLMALLDHEKDHLADVDRALARLAAGSYGVCESCSGPIAPARLAARPVARTCIGCAGARR